MIFSKYFGNNIISKVSLLLIICVIGYFVFQFPVNAFSHDVFGYYLYLPLTFKYNNLDIHNFDAVQEIINKYHNTESFYQAFKLETGNWVMKYSMGMAIMYLPFYFIGDLFAQALNYPTDGFSSPYQISVLIGCFIYTILGIWILRKVLLHFFSDQITAIVLILVVFGTNYFFHVSFHGQGLMSHNILFMLHAFTIWNTIRWYQLPKTKYLIYLGISIGLAAIIRPTEIIIISFPFLYSVFNLKTFQEKFVLFFKTYRLQFFLMLFIVFVIVSYQLFYWKLMTGKFLFNSYSSNPAEGLNFLHPYILEVLFSFRKGWFIYTPIMLFAVIGFIALYKNSKIIFFALLVYTLLNFYIVSSWSCWWYAASYSSRALIPSYAFMSIPLGFFIKSVLDKKIKFVLIPLFFILIALNLFQTWQSSVGILDSARMTRPLYKSIFFQTIGLSDEQRKLLLIDKYGMSSENFIVQDTVNYKIAYSKQLNFEKDFDKYEYRVDTIENSPHSCILTNQNNPFAPSIDNAYKDLSSKSYIWVRASIWVYSNHNLDSLPAALVVSMTHKDVSYKFREELVEKHQFKKGAWNRIEKYFLTPDFMDRNDKIHVFFWNRSDKNIYVDDMKVEVLEPIIDETVF